jgi:uncharacterized Zn finger protein (UPF0148 family)
MKCPKCGCEIQDGSLYCSFCGEDIRIVPDFEEDLDETIQQNIQNIIVDIEQENDEKEAQRDKRTICGTGRKRKFLISGLIALGVLLLFLILGLIYINTQYSASYHASKAQKYVTEEKYDDAIQLYRQALDLDPTNVTYRIALADLYYITGDMKAYEYRLRNLLSLPECTGDTLQLVYEKLIALFLEQSNIDALNTLILDSTNPTIKKMFAGYVAEAPTFSVNEGFYSNIQVLKLSNNGKGKIYYTLDGTEPTTKSIHYTTPIFLNSGDYYVKAVFVSEEGISSEIISKRYFIDDSVVAAPEININSGEYSSPVLLEVLDNQGDVYFTTDGTLPTLQSKLYTEPIPVPLGNTVYKIARIVNGVVGEVAERNISLTCYTSFTPQNAVDAVVQYVQSIGRIWDASGRFDDTNAAFLYEYLYPLPIQGVGDYYVIAEVLRNTQNVLNRTGTFYALDIYKGTMYLLSKDHFGQYQLVEINKEENSHAWE